MEWTGMELWSGEDVEPKGGGDQLHTEGHHLHHSRLMEILNRREDEEIELMSKAVMTGF